MTPLEAWCVRVANLLVISTGLVYAWMRYLLRPSDPFAVVNHPWQPAVQHLHVLVAPLLVFAIGLVWKRHVAMSLRLEVRERHRSGLALALSFAPMAASGYLLQVATGDAWRRVWVVVHLATSALWLGGFLIHQLGRRRRAWLS